ncbi:MAG: hypothetical protein H0X39_11590 [Actinobacteria bacterium]|nr:hypothetical protein [Actinomycetota bacterium]
MSDDPVSRYRDALRDAAIRRAASLRRRRRASIAFAIVASALFIVGGAIAAKQTHWLSADAGVVQVEMRFAAHQRLGSLLHGYSNCLSGAGGVAVKRCAPYVAAITATCLLPSGKRRRITRPAASRCAVVLIRRVDPTGGVASAHASSHP